MSDFVNVGSESKGKAIANATNQEETSVELASTFSDNRPQAIAQHKLSEAINASSRVQQLKSYQQVMNTASPVRQLQSNRAVPIHYDSPILQRKEQFQNESQAESPTETTILQRKDDLAEKSVVGKVDPIQKKENNTGLPDSLKTGVESLSGYSMDDVKVHYNSDKPAQLQAHAFAQGTDIHMAPGQEQHLGHEAWHIVQQKQGRVQPTVQMKGDVPVNDDEGLEKEADVMGAKANQFFFNSTETVAQRQVLGNSLVIQRNPAQAGTIAGGHSYQKHVVDQKEWGDPPMTRQAFTPIVAGVMNNPDSSKNLSGGRKAYWKGGVVVIYNPNAGDKGTCFKPNAGKSYYDNLT